MTLQGSGWKFPVTRATPSRLFPICYIACLGMWYKPHCHIDNGLTPTGPRHQFAFNVLFTNNKATIYLENIKNEIYQDFKFRKFQDCHLHLSISQDAFWLFLLSSMGIKGYIKVVVLSSTWESFSFFPSKTDVILKQNVIWQVNLRIFCNLCHLTASLSRFATVSWLLHFVFL